MIRAKIEEYRVTKDSKVLEEIKLAAQTDKKAAAFLFTVEKEAYKDALLLRQKK